ncbi:hypothetical protein [Prevotella pallens]|nr:hypothetical protein [Prevotella pallens]
MVRVLQCGVFRRYVVVEETNHVRLKWRTVMGVVETIPAAT